METNVKIAISSVIVGMTIGYAIGRRRSEAEFESAVEEAIQERAEYFERREDELRSDHEVAQNELRDALVESQNELVTYSASLNRAEAAAALYRGEEDFDSEILAAIRVQQEDAAVRLGQQYVGKPAPELISEGVLPLNYPHRDEEVVHDPESIISLNEMKREMAMDYANYNMVSQNELRDAIVDRSKPYLITAEVFIEGEMNFHTSTLTYYEGDDTLAGEQDEIFDDQTRLLLVGTNLSDFGPHGDPPNEIHIRNEAMQMDLEVVRHQGRFAEVVAGLGGDG